MISVQLARSESAANDDVELNAHTKGEGEGKGEGGVEYKSLSWQKAAALLFAEYVCLAMVSFPWSFSVLGFAGGTLITLTMALIVLYTSYVLWQFCLKYPDVRDACDIGKILLGPFIGEKLAYEFTTVMFVFNNMFICALHVLVGAKWFNTISDHAACTNVFMVVMAIICFFFSLPRTFSAISVMGIASAFCMGTAVLLCIIFAGVQDHPAGWVTGDDIKTYAGAYPGTTLVVGTNAMLNIAFTLIGQVCLPSFIADMKNPKDFPKALYAVTVAEIIMFTLCGALVYHYVGYDLMTSPAFGSLTEVYKKVSFTFAVPTLIIIGVIYSYVTSRFIFHRALSHTRHYTANTWVSWAVWTGVVLCIWIVGFIIAEVIPFFSDLLSLVATLFGSWFGFIFWGLAYLDIHKGKWWDGLWRSTQTLFNFFLIIVGFGIFIGLGSYASVSAIKDDYASGAIRSPFECTSNGL